MDSNKSAECEAKGMPVDVYSLIRQAILDKQQVVATYHGHRREMCPHVIGTKTGRMQALFYQSGGSSNSGLGPAGSGENWRCIPIDGLSDVSVKPGTWHTAPNHSRAQTGADVIDVEAPY